MLHLTCRLSRFTLSLDLSLGLSIDLSAVHSLPYNVVYYKLLLKIDQKSDLHEIKVFQHGLLNFQLMISI